MSQGSSIHTLSERSTPSQVIQDLVHPNYSTSNKHHFFTPLCLPPHTHTYALLHLLPHYISLPLLPFYASASSCLLSATFYFPWLPSVFSFPLPPSYIHQLLLLPCLHLPILPSYLCLHILPPYLYLPLPPNCPLPLLFPYICLLSPCLT